MCDTLYHDVQHVLDVTLAMARLMDGFERSRRDAPALGVHLYQLGIIVALFHDIGYLRSTLDTVAKNGAEHTLNHDSRGAAFLRHYLPQIGMGKLVVAGAELVHFKGFEKRVADILVQDPLMHILGACLVRRISSRRCRIAAIWKNAGAGSTRSLWRAG